MIRRQDVIDELLKEYTYWRNVESDDDNTMAVAMGSVANVLARIMLIDPVAPHQDA